MADEGRGLLCPTPAAMWRRAMFARRWAIASKTTGARFVLEIARRCHSSAAAEVLVSAGCRGAAHGGRIRVRESPPIVNARREQIVGGGRLSISFPHAESNCGDSRGRLVGGVAGTGPVANRLASRNEALGRGHPRSCLRTGGECSDACRGRDIALSSGHRRARWCGGRPLYGPGTPRQRGCRRRLCRGSFGVSKDAAIRGHPFRRPLERGGECTIACRERDINLSARHQGGGTCGGPPPAAVRSG